MTARPLLTLAVAAAALLLSAAPAAASGGSACSVGADDSQDPWLWPAMNARRVPQLDAALPAIRGERILVSVTNAGLNSFVSIPRPHIYVSSWVCEMLVNGKPGDINDTYQVPWDQAVFVLYHEWSHLAFQEYNEQQTDRDALVLIRYMLRRFWAFSPAQAQASYDYLSGRLGNLPNARTPYRPTFSPNARDPLLDLEAVR